MDTGDQKQVKKAKKKQKLQNQIEREELKALLKDPTFRRFLWRFMERCGIYHTTFTGESLSSAFEEGKRQIGLWTVTEIFSADVRAYGLMMAENQKEEKDDE